MYPTNMLTGLLYISHSKDNLVPEANHVGYRREVLPYSFKNAKTNVKTFYT